MQVKLKTDEATYLLDITGEEAEAATRDNPGSDEWWTITEGWLVESGEEFPLSHAETEDIAITHATKISGLLKEAGEDIEIQGAVVDDLFEGLG